MSTAQRTCSIEGCDRLHRARGWCRIHYRRWQAHGDPLYIRPTLAERFWPKVTVRGPDDCWEWQRCRNELGYGKLNVGGRAGRPVSAHRVAWALTFGPIPNGLWVLHHCDNPPCVNPAHLWLGTVADNTADMIAKGRDRRVALRGSRNGNARLSSDQIAAIRHAQDASQTTLAKQYGVGQSTISRVLRGQSWAHERSR